MPFSLILAAAAAVAAAPAPAEAPRPALVEAGRADWASFPALVKVRRPHPTGAMVDRVAAMLREGECRIDGQSHRRFDITVPYLVLVRPDGSAERVLVADIGCPSLETFVGGIVLHLAAAGDFRASGAAEPLWYASRMNFNAQ